MTLPGCSRTDETSAELTPTSSVQEIEAEAKSIREAASEAAALIESDANAEITAQEISEQKEAAKPAADVTPSE